MSGSRGMSLGGAAAKITETEKPAANVPPASQTPDNQTPGDEPQGGKAADDEEGRTTVAVPGPPSVAQSGVPVCPIHNCPMHAGSTQADNAKKGGNGATSYYRCQVPDCDQRDQLRRPATSVFKKAIECPSRTCQDNKKKTKKVTYLVKNPKIIAGAHVKMQCPKCAFSVDVPNPVFAAKPPAPNIPPNYGAR